MPAKNIYFEAYIEWVMEYINAGYEPFLITFMFNQMHGTERRVAARMAAAIERFYAMILTRVVRNPSRAKVYGDFPLLIAAPDWPVHSHLKMSVEDNTVNDGMHWHGIYLVPPRSRMPVAVHRYLGEHQGKYAGPTRSIMRIHAVPIEISERKAIGYALKQIDRRRIDQDALAILPKVQSEMPGFGRA